MREKKRSIRKGGNDDNAKGGMGKEGGWKTVEENGKRHEEKKKEKHRKGSKV